MAIDTETRDDSLALRRGPGWAYGAGHVAGVSWSAEGSEGYAPIRHPDTPNLFPREQVGAWLRDLVRSGTRLIFQNAPYDVGWIWADLGAEIPSGHPIDDTLAASFVLDENHNEYNLDAICARLGLEGKDEALLREAGVAYMRPAGAPKSWRLTDKILKTGMWRMPARFVGPYAEADASRTRAAMRQMRPALDAQELVPAYRLEMDIVPLVFRMRRRGIRLDTDLLERRRDEFAAKAQACLDEISRQLPGRRRVTIDDLRTNKWTEPTFESEGIRFPMTKGARPVGSFTKDWMEKHEHWLPRLCVRAEKYASAAEKFVQGYLLDYAHRGRLHAEIHQYKSDEGGTVSYRFSYSAPPLQQMPSPDIDAEIGGGIREGFVADETWGCCDYSQQEYRLTAHFAAACRVTGGVAAAGAYVLNPDLDYHKMVADLTGLPRSKAKIQNFAILYGQGLDATAAQLGVPKEEAEALRKTVEEKAPFGPALSDYTRRRAQDRGYIRLLDGARCRFDEWEASWLSKEERARGYREQWSMAPCSREEALERRKNPSHPWHKARLRRAYVNKAMNRLVQGSAARQTKMAMRECDRAGIDPILQMHDELNCDGPPEQAARMAEIMRGVAADVLLVPMKVDLGVGSNWAAAKGK